LFAPWGDIAADAPFDVIVCNPPYVAVGDSAIEKNVRDHEPPVALFAGPEGLDVIRRLAGEASLWVRTGGHLLIEMAYNQASAVRALLGGPDWQDVTTYRDGAGHERVISARRT
jgi:release factor glutamine methyltransferase